MTQEELKELARFDVRISTQAQKDAMERMRAFGKNFAKQMFEDVPKSADRSAAIRYLRLAVMQANAAIMHDQGG